MISISLSLFLDVIVTANTSELEVVLFTGLAESVELRPPMGPASNNYLVSLGVTVEDFIGSSATVIFAIVTVTILLKQHF